MNILLDTHAIIWFFNGDEKLSKKARIEIEDPRNNKFVSIVSIWELSIKISLNKIILPKGLKHFIKLVEENGFEIIPISIEHAIVVSSLDFIHRDPFDRLLIAQSKIENLTLVTKDEFIRQYKIKTIWD